MKTRCIMIQGTMSDAGKSVVCAALCRIFKQDGYKLYANILVVNRIKKHYKFSYSRPYEGTVKQVRIKRSPLGEYYLYVVTDAVSGPYRRKTLEGASVGMDFGMKTYLTMSDGNKIDNPEFLKRSLGELRQRYDTRFAAHVVPCDIDYQLSEPVDPGLLGIDYVEAYLARLLVEARWIARFDVEGCIAVLERACPDYRGMHVNLCDLLLPHEDELLLSSVRNGW